MTATLVLADGSRVRLLPGSHTVGRKAGEADLVVGSEKSISRKHAVLRCDALPRASVLDLGAEEPGVVLLDSGSTFGTFVNGARLEKGAWCPLQSGDQLAFGSVRSRAPLLDPSRSLSRRARSTRRPRGAARWSSRRSWSLPPASPPSTRLSWSAPSPAPPRWARG